MKGEPIRLKSGQIVGEYFQGAFLQTIEGRHIYNAGAGKGMDKWVHFQLKVKGCRTWRLTVKGTKQVLELPFARIEADYRLKRITGAGEQFVVPFADFQETRPVLQPSLFEGGPK